MYIFAYSEEPLTWSLDDDESNYCDWTIEVTRNNTIPHAHAVGERRNSSRRPTPTTSHGKERHSQKNKTYVRRSSHGSSGSLGRSCSSLGGGRRSSEKGGSSKLVQHYHVHKVTLSFKYPSLPSYKFRISNFSSNPFFTIQPSKAILSMG